MFRGYIVCMLGMNNAREIMVKCPICKVESTAILTISMDPTTGIPRESVGNCHCTKCDHKWVFEVEEEKRLLELERGTPTKLNGFAKEVHALAKEKGWWDKGEEKTFGDLIALIHSELSETLEEYRNHHAPQEVYYNEGNPKPEGIGIELADAVIRILDMCARYEIDLDTCIKIKHTYNKTRPIRHGGKKL